MILKRSHLIVALSILLYSDGAPTTYDQRQDGQMNVRADLDNFFFVIVTKGSFFNDLSLLDFKSMARQLMAGQKGKIVSLNEPISSTVTNEDVKETIKNGKPYKVDIVRIPKNDDNALRDLKIVEELGRQEENRKEEDSELTQRLDDESESLPVSDSSGSSIGSKDQVERTSAKTTNKLQ